MKKTPQQIARLFLGHIFLLAGVSKIGAYAGTQSNMEAMNVSGALDVTNIGAFETIIM